jgi:hypothetical protein
MLCATRLGLRSGSGIRLTGSSSEVRESFSEVTGKVSEVRESFSEVTGKVGEVRESFSEVGGKPGAAAGAKRKT